MDSFIKVVLKKGKEQSIQRQHPWVFSGAIHGMTDFPKNGEVVEVVDMQDRCLGYGHYSEGSISVRIFSFEKTFENGKAFWKNKIQQAFNVRKSLGLVDNGSTNIYRLIHAEGDGLPGLIVDIYGSTAVIQSHSSGMHQLRDFIKDAILEVYDGKITTVYDKSAEKLNKNAGEASADSYLHGSNTDNIGLEHDCKFYIDWEEGQKTGFFIDQRENRRLLGELSHGKKVLNTFCYTGGFSVYALRAGATVVHSLDSSQKALDLTLKNVELNGFGDSNHKVIKADAVDYMKNLEEDYDIIVLDPPAFAKHLSARHKAVQGYKRINEAAISQIKPGGIIFTFSCSQAVDKQLFTNTVIASAISAGRRVRILYQLHQPADHPISAFHPEGEYLKGLVLMVE
ncbi:MAG: class I SAM-dependent rRNA methyltransferase [Flavobacteriales bacterium]